MLKNTVLKIPSRWSLICEAHPRTILWLSFMIVIVFFLITRLPYLLYYPVPSLQPDYSSYWQPLHQMKMGVFPPIFNYRTPGYPLFMGAVLLFSNKLMSIVLVQNFLSLLAAVTMVYCIYRVFCPLTLLAAVAITAYVTSMSQVITDMALLTESLFTNFLILSIALLIVALKERNLRFFVISSACMALSIYVRPTGQFFIVTYVMVLLYMLRNRYAPAGVVGFAIPFFLIIVLLPSYNYSTYGKFNITNGKEVTLLCGTQFYLQKKPAYSGELNLVIEKIRGKFSKEDRETVVSSWNLDKFVSSYYKNDYWIIEDILKPFANVPEVKTMGLLRVYEMVAFNSIRRNLPIFLKLYLMNLRLYFFRDIGITYNFYGGILPDSYDLLCIKKAYGEWTTSESERRSLLLEFYDPPRIDHFVKEATVDGYKVEIIPTHLQRIHSIYDEWNRKIFRKAFWPIISLMLCGVSLILFIVSRFRNEGAFIMLLVTSSALGHGMICSIFANTPRFSAPTEFLYYLSVALIPILLSGGRSALERGREEAE